MKVNRKETGDRRQETEEYLILNWRKQLISSMKLGEIVVTSWNRIFSIGLVLALILCFSLDFIPSAAAVPDRIASEMEASSQGDRLPPKVAKAVVADLAKLQKISPAKLKVVKYDRESWSDGCLGLPQPEEICSQAIVEGWRVVVSDGSQEWVYRTDGRGRNVRLESPKSANL